MIRLHFTPPDSDAAWDAWIQDGREAVAKMLADGPSIRAFSEVAWKVEVDER